MQGDPVPQIVTGTVMNSVINAEIEGGGHSVELNQCSFNVKGFKQSHVYCSKLLSKCDVLGICETWLRPGELSTTNQTLLKSPDLHGMDEGGGVNKAYNRLSTTHGHITDCKLDSVVYAGVCVVN